MEELGFKRKDRDGKEIWKNQFNDRVTFDKELKAVYLKDETGRSFPATKKVLLAIANRMEEKGW